MSNPAPANNGLREDDQLIVPAQAVNYIRHGAGAPVVLMHGLAANALSMREMAVDLLGCRSAERDDRESCNADGSNSSRSQLRFLVDLLCPVWLIGHKSN